MPDDIVRPYGKEHPAELIQARIREKRLYEARFLFRQLGDEMEVLEREALQAKLTGLFTRIEQLRAQARELMRQGRKGEADEVYGVIEDLARDMPGLAEEKQALAQRGTPAAPVANANEQPSLENTAPLITAVAATGKQPSVFPPIQLQPLFTWLRHRLRSWHWAVLALLVLMLAMLLLRPAEKPSRESLQLAVAEQAVSQAIVIRPMVASEQETTSLPRQTDPASDALPADTAEIPAVQGKRVHVGALQVEESTRRP